LVHFNSGFTAGDRTLETKNYRGASLAYSFQGRTIAIIDVSIFQKAKEFSIIAVRNKNQKQLLTKSFTIPKTLGKHSAFFKKKGFNLPKLRKYILNPKNNDFIDLSSKSFAPFIEFFKCKIESRKKWDNVIIAKKVGKEFKAHEILKVKEIKESEILKDLRTKLSQDKGQIKIIWDPMYDNETIVATNIYRAKRKSGIYKRLNKTPIIFIESEEQKKKKKGSFANFIDNDVQKNHTYFYRVNLLLAGLVEMRGKVLEKIIFLDRDKKKVPPDIKLVQANDKIVVSWEQKNPWLVKSYKVFTRFFDEEKFLKTSEVLSSKTRKHEFKIRDYDKKHYVYIEAQYTDKSILKSFEAALRIEPPEYKKTSEITKLEYHPKEKRVYLQWTLLKDIPEYTNIENYVVVRGFNEKKLFFIKEMALNQTSFIDKKVEPAKSITTQ